MKRDMDLIRELLLKLEAYPLRAGGMCTFSAFDDEEIRVEGFNYNEIDYHLALLKEAAFIDDGGVRPMSGIGFRGLTWAGHDFLDSVRDPKIWLKTMKAAEIAAGGFTVDLLKDLAKGLIKKQIEEYAGIKL